MFRRRELEKRELAKREIEEKYHTSLVWIAKKLSREMNWREQIYTYAIAILH